MERMTISKTCISAPVFIRGWLHTSCLLPSRHPRTQHGIGGMKHMQTKMPRELTGATEAIGPKATRCLFVL